MLLNTKDFETKNELIYGFSEDDNFDYFDLVHKNAKQGAEDDDTTQKEYIISRYIFGFKYCPKLRTDASFEKFIELKPSAIHMSELLGEFKESHKVVLPHFKMPKKKDYIWEVYLNYGDIVDVDNYNEVIQNGMPSYIATKIFIKHKHLQTIIGLGAWVASKPTIVQIEQVLNEIPISRHRLIILLYTQVKGDKTFSPIVEEVAKETQSMELLKGFTLDSRW